MFQVQNDKMRAIEKENTMHTDVDKSSEWTNGPVSQGSLRFNLLYSAPTPVRKMPTSIDIR